MRRIRLTSIFGKTKLMSGSTLHFLFGLIRVSWCLFFSLSFDRQLWSGDATEIRLPLFSSTIALRIPAARHSLLSGSCKKTMEPESPGRVNGTSRCTQSITSTLVYGKPSTLERNQCLEICQLSHQNVIHIS